MSVGAGISAATPVSRLTRRLALMAGAVALASLLVALLAWLVAPGLAAPPPRSPFGIGFREAAPAATGLGGLILSLQASFSRAMNAAVLALKGGGEGTPLIGLAFAYGVFHAAGPGHGKAVIAGYIMAGERAFRRGCALGACAALLQAVVAMALVGVGSLVLNATAAMMTHAGTLIETASFALVAVVGLALTWRKAGQLAGGRPAAECGPDCAHVPDARVAAELRSWREGAGIVLAAGSRPCAGAVLVLVFALSQGVAWAGILAVLAMAAGTALTTMALAALAVFAKRLALALAGGRGQAGTLALGGLELVAAAFVLVLGVTMLAGLK